MASINYAAWRDVCDWAKNNTPHGTVFVVPKNARTFTWYSERGTVVNWKDVPQNAVGLIQWRDRIRDFYVRPNPNKPGAYLWNDTLVLQPPARLKAMAKKYGAELMITNARTPIDLPKVYENRNFTVYSLQ